MMLISLMVKNKVSQEHIQTLVLLIIFLFHGFRKRVSQNRYWMYLYPISPGLLHKQVEYYWVWLSIVTLRLTLDLFLRFRGVQKTNNQMNRWDMTFGW